MCVCARVCTCVCLCLHASHWTWNHIAMVVDGDICQLAGHTTNGAVKERIQETSMKVRERRYLLTSRFDHAFHRPFDQSFHRPSNQMRTSSSGRGRRPHATSKLLGPAPRAIRKCIAQGGHPGWLPSQLPQLRALNKTYK